MSKEWREGLSLLLVFGCILFLLPFLCVALPWVAVWAAREGMLAQAFILGLASLWFWYATARLALMLKDALTQKAIDRA
jgi:hypothetical protein